MTVLFKKIEIIPQKSKTNLYFGHINLKSQTNDNVMFVRELSHWRNVLHHQLHTLICKTYFIADVNV